MNNERTPKPNNNNASRPNIVAPRQSNINSNATQRNRQNPKNAAQPSKPLQKRPEPNVVSPRFTDQAKATAQRQMQSTSVPPQKRPQNPTNAAQHNNIRKSAPPPRPVDPNLKQNDQPPRRRNDESYVFSRSLAETRERILEERRERLEDARKFQKEDVRMKLRVGIIILVAVILVVTIAISAIVSCSLGSDKPKKTKGEYVYLFGTNTTELSYSDSVKNGVFYVSMNDVAELCGMTLSGSAATELRFTSKNGDWVAFTPNSSTARINGYSISMSYPAYIQDTKCSIPLDFLDLVLDGVSISVDLEKKEISILRDEYSDSTPLEPHYVEVGFALRIDSILSPIDENKYFSGQALFSFKADLAEYEKYMNPSDKDSFLILLNKQNPCDEDYEPEDLTVIDSKWVNPSKSSYVTLDLNKTASMALEAMLLEMRAEGFSDIYVTSAYRSYTYQSNLYNNTYLTLEMSGFSADAYAVLGEAYIKANYLDKGLTGLNEADARRVVDSYSAVPGYSEHHTGLCVDLITTDMSELTNAFANKDVYDWLCANAWKFGFILRYPEDKVDVTGYSFESWHWRFVGRDTALEMFRSGECFEEYLARTTATE